MLPKSFVLHWRGEKCNWSTHLCHLSVINILIFFIWRNSPQWSRPSSFTRFLYHIQRRTTVCRTDLDEWSARRTDLYLTTHNKHKGQTSIPPVGFDHTISAGERPQTYALDRAATETGKCTDLKDLYSTVTVYQLFMQNMIFFCGALPQLGHRSPLFEASQSHTIRPTNTTTRMTPLKEWSTHLSYRHLQNKQKHKRRTSMRPAEFKSATLAVKRLQTCALDGLANGAMN
jgi:hypothetical protein